MLLRLERQVGPSWLRVITSCFLVPLWTFCLQSFYLQVTSTFLRTDETRWLHVVLLNNEGTTILVLGFGGSVVLAWHEFCDSLNVMDHFERRGLRRGWWVVFTYCVKALFARLVILRLRIECCRGLFLLLHLYLLLILHFELVRRTTFRRRYIMISNFHKWICFPLNAGASSFRLDNSATLPPAARDTTTAHRRQIHLKLWIVWWIYILLSHHIGR